MSVKQSSRPWFIALPLIFALVSDGQANPAYAPEWAGTPGSTRVYYVFTNDYPMPEPTLFDNAYGTPSALILPDEIFGTGWQDPEDPLDLVRVPDHGTWDLGKSGTMAFDVPIGFPGKEMTVFLYLIAYQGITDMPAISIAGYDVSEVSQTDALVQQDTLGSWWSRTWSGNLTPEAMEEHLTVLITGAESGSVVDVVDIHMIPEPTVLLLVLLGALLIRRRTHSHSAS